jgi:hypothetical protein
MYISSSRATIASSNNTTFNTQTDLYHSIDSPLHLSHTATHSNIFIMSQNPDAVVNQGEFAGHVKPSEPLMTGGVSQNVISFVQALESAGLHT